MIAFLATYCRDIAKGLWAVALGMKVTFRHLVAPTVTMQYPDEKWHMPPNFRGLIACDKDACIACDLCAKACPIDCILVEGIKEPGKKTKTCTVFVVDYQKCMFCGLCVDPCPTEAIFHSHIYEASQYDREGCVINWVDHTIRNPFVKNRKDEGAKKPAAAAKPAPAKAEGAAAAAHAPAAAGTAVADAPKPTKITKVWIEPGCIVCDLCEDTCPDVFDVQAETCIVRPDANLAPGNTDRIVEAAIGCPVNVIKYE